MQTSHLLGAAALAVVALTLFGDRHRSAPKTKAASPARTVLPAVPAVADGHYVLVVEGDRNGLTVTFASKKPAPWGGRPKGFDSNWRLSVRDAQDVELVDIPLDVRPFATGAASLGKPVVVQGCIVVDSRIGMLVNVPRYAEAESYRFTRTDADGTETVLGTVAAAKVRDLAGDVR